MNVSHGKKGPVIFVLILVVVAAIAFLAFGITGPMGIEDRFNRAVGLPSGGEPETGSPSGISVEGDPLLYVIVIVVLLTAGFAAYRYFPAQETESGSENSPNETDSTWPGKKSE